MIKKTKLIIVFIFFIVFICISYTLYNYYPRTQQFLITSHGHTATTWLALVLSSHPEIGCSHHTYSLQPPKKLKPSLHAPISLVNYFAELKSQAKPQFKAIGNIHGFVYSEIQQQLKKMPNLTVVNMIRHPISRIESARSNWLKTKKALDIANAEFYQESLRYAELVNKKYKLDFKSNINAYMFLKALSQQDQVYTDMRLAKENKILQIKYEEITKDPALLGKLINYITHGKVQVSYPMLKILISKPAQNTNNVKKLTEQQVYATWPEWQKYAFYLHLSKNGRFDNNIYTNLGYDLSFIEYDKFAVTNPMIIVNSLLKSGSTYLEKSLQNSLGYKVKILPFISNKKQLTNIMNNTSLDTTLTKQHFIPTELNVALFKTLTDRIVIHVRDPRQVLLSWVHHLHVAKTYEDEIVFYKDIGKSRAEYLALDFQEQVDLCIKYFLPRATNWINGWLAIQKQEAAKENGLKILLTTYDELVTDEIGLFNKILQFYELDPNIYAFTPAKKNANVRFRKGDQNEWKQAFTQEQKNKIASIVPESLLLTFGWDTDTD